MNFNEIKSPTLLINKQQCKNNIEAITQKLKPSNTNYRPHFKTHQLPEVGEWFKSYGVNSITVSSLKMANKFVNDWNDIAIAFPLNIREIAEINALANKVKLTITIASLETIDLLKQRIKSKLNVYLEVDAGYGRTGFNALLKEPIVKAIQQLNAHPLLSFAGFISHFGNTYLARSAVEIQTMYSQSLSIVNNLRNQLSSQFGNIALSIGDTPSASVIEKFDGVDELRAGNLVYYDLMQHQTSACKKSDISVCMACPVVYKNNSTLQITVHGGAVHFSKEFITINNQTIYGEMASLTHNGWQLLDDFNPLIKISQEHGTLQLCKAVFETIHIGNLIGILPVHSCLTANLNLSPESYKII